MSRKLSFSLAVRSLQGGCEFLRASFALKLSVVQIAASGRPAQFEMGGIVFTRMSYVFEIVGQLESTHPQAVADMLAHASMFTIGPDGIASRVSGVVTSTPLYGVDADVGCALELQSASTMELKVSKGATEWHFPWEMGEHRGRAIRPLSPSLTSAELRCAVGNGAR